MYIFLEPGYDVKTVDVRIIAATNKNLYEMVSKKEFREDLYYRLKVGYAKIPPIRERKEDIALLSKNFLNKDSNYSVKMDNEVMLELVKYNWYGNVREIRNAIMYMIAVCDGNFISMKDLPPNNFFQGELETIKENDMDDLNKKILEIIKDFNTRNEIISRKKITEILSDTSEYRVRKCLSQLEDYGHISIMRGKSGIKLI